MPKKQPRSVDRQDIDDDITHNNEEDFETSDHHETQEIQVVPDNTTTKTEQNDIEDKSENKEKTDRLEPDSEMNLNKEQDAEHQKDKQKKPKAKPIHKTNGTPPKSEITYDGIHNGTMRALGFLFNPIASWAGILKGTKYGKPVVDFLGSLDSEVDREIAAKHPIQLVLEWLPPTSLFLQDWTEPGKALGRAMLGPFKIILVAADSVIKPLSFIGGLAISAIDISTYVALKPISMVIEFGASGVKIGSDNKVKNNDPLGSIPSQLKDTSNATAPEQTVEDFSVYHTEKHTIREKNRNARDNLISRT